jgi:hypothetical protein
MMKRVFAATIAAVMMFAAVPSVAVAETADESDWVLAPDGLRWVGGDVSHVVIPEMFDGQPVTALGGDAFRNNTSLESVTIPDSVTTIGSRAFEGCTNLEVINISSNISRIAPNAFNNTAWLANQPHGVVYLDYIALGWLGGVAEHNRGLPRRSCSCGDFRPRVGRSRNCGRNRDSAAGNRAAECVGFGRAVMKRTAVALALVFAVVGCSSDTSQNQESVCTEETQSSTESTSVAESTPTETNSTPIATDIDDLPPWGGALPQFQEEIDALLAQHTSGDVSSIASLPAAISECMRGTLTRTFIPALSDQSVLVGLSELPYEFLLREMGGGRVYSVFKSPQGGHLFAFYSYGLQHHAVYVVRRLEKSDMSSLQIGDCVSAVENIDPATLEWRRIAERYEGTQSFHSKHLLADGLLAIEYQKVEGEYVISDIQFYEDFTITVEWEVGDDEVWHIAHDYSILVSDFPQ